MPSQPTWAIVATVAEPVPLIQAFVAHHLAMGASEVHLYFDRADDPAADQFDHLPQVRVTRCDRAWFQSIGVISRPRRQNNRQSITATHAQSRSGADFMLHCDADEFLRPSSQPARELAETDGWTRWLKVFNLERAFVLGAPRRTIFDGVFKWHMQGAEATPLRCTELTPFGFTGHAAGKPMVRVALGMNIGIHVPRWGAVQDRLVPPHQPANLMELVHFDGLTPLHWAAKFLRHAAMIPKFIAQQPDWRIAQAEAVFAVFDTDGALEALYDRINAYTPSEVETLRDEGFIVDDPFDLASALAAAFPGEKIDLSPAAFDELLRPRVHRWLRKARRNGLIPD